MRRRIITTTALGAIGLLALSACSAGGNEGGNESRGDITIWYSNNEAEIEWGKQMVEAWNADHPAATTVQLADGAWHNVIAMRICDRAEV